MAGIRSIIEPGSTLPPEMLQRRGYALDAAATEQASNVSPISPGQLDNRASVTVVFVLK